MDVLRKRSRADQDDARAAGIGVRDVFAGRMEFVLSRKMELNTWSSDEAYVAHLFASRPSAEEHENGGFAVLPGGTEVGEEQANGTGSNIED